MTVQIVPNGGSTSNGRLADVELHFDGRDGPLNGLKLVGFAVWQGRAREPRRVTLPARSYSLGGERGTYVLLRPIASTSDRLGTEGRLKELILQAFEAHQREPVSRVAE
jgi:hypothetical protein